MGYHEPFPHPCWMGLGQGLCLSSTLGSCAAHGFQGHTSAHNAVSNQCFPQKARKEGSLAGYICIFISSLRVEGLYNVSCFYPQLFLDPSLLLFPPNFVSFFFKKKTLQAQCVQLKYPWISGLQLELGNLSETTPLEKSIFLSWLLTTAIFLHS